MNSDINDKGFGFLDDVEKIRDLFLLSKDEFLESYSYINERNYDETLKSLFKLIRGNVNISDMSYITLLDCLSKDPYFSTDNLNERRSGFLPAFELENPPEVKEYNSAGFEILYKNDTFEISIDRNTDRLHLLNIPEQQDFVTKYSREAFKEAMVYAVKNEKDYEIGE